MLRAGWRFVDGVLVRETNVIRLLLRWMGALSLVLTVIVAPARQIAAQDREQDADDAAATAVELSRFEATGDFNALYDRIHPDAHAVIPRAAVIGWFQNEWAPLGPGVSTVTEVRFVAWTWDVTGQTYPITAEVSFEQPFADGSVRADVVRLVQDDRGEWRWFFGRTRDFVEEQIARYVPHQPSSDTGANPVDRVAADIDAYWRLAFDAANRPYVSPTVTPASGPVLTGCDVGDPSDGPFYCARDQTIYYTPAWFADAEQQVGDFAWITVLAHEWGHHIQYSLSIEHRAGNAYELQADCLAGAYAQDAGTRRLLDPGDITEAVAMSASAGDPVWLPQGEPGTHGINDDRITSFMRGYLDGFVGCNLPIGPTS